MNKTVSITELVAEVRSGLNIAIGGGGLLRKPMGAVAAIATSDAADLEVTVFLGGPDVDVLVAARKVSLLRFAYVGFDALGLAPNFRQARQGDWLPVVEYSEQMMIMAIDAAAKGLPFMPTRSGRGTDVMNTATSPFRTFQCPVSDESLVAVPAVRPDIAIIHVNLADITGNSVIFGDVFIDHLLARAARRTFVTAEKVVDQVRARDLRLPHTFISRPWIAGVCELPKGGGFTGVYPDYPCNFSEALEYQRNATNAAWFSSFLERGAMLRTEDRT